MSFNLQQSRTAKEISPLVELEKLLRRMDDRLQRVKESYLRSIRPSPSLVESLAGVSDKSGKNKKSFFSFRRTTPSESTSATATADSSLTTPANDGSQRRPHTEKSSLLGSNGANGDGDSGQELASSKTAAKPTSAYVKKQAIFISIPEQESLVEDLRRIAELVVIGENYVTSLEKKVQKEFAKSREKWKRADHDIIDGGDGGIGVDISIDEPPKEEDENDKEGKDLRSPDFADVFDLFFECNTLAIWVDLLTGRGFDLTEEELEEEHVGNSTSTASSADTRWSTQQAKGQHQNILLPPLVVATQVVQSVSILVQNVSRATSLYILFSNDHINDLINLNLELYEQAERNRRQHQRTKSASSSDASMIFASPEVAELSTHFVTFLKSLALRINAETLQFFLQYPGKKSSEPPSSENTNNLPLSGNAIDGYTASNLVSKFPLYDRALDFCAAHQESFVRVTAMNICLNTIRLTTVADPDLNDKHKINNNCEDGLEELEGAFGGAVLPASGPGVVSASTPDGNLQNAQALPFRERLAIAHYTCTPSRVERLIAPIFTKLSEKWSSLDEAIRAMDAFDQTCAQEPGARSEKVAKVREKVKREKLFHAFRDKTADLQDELLLLDDVFTVGLTVLNEQMIEMMMATFVYPLLLQPLILFSQRFAATVLERSNSSSLVISPSTFDHPFGLTFSTDNREAQAQLMAVTGPAKTALFTMAAAFQFLTNPPLLRLMFTALLHPISPDSTTVPTVRSSLQVATVDNDGRGIIRVDAENEGKVVPDSRVSYPFGTKDGTNRLSTTSSFSRTINGSFSNSRGEDACVFVLAPALAEVLQFRGQDYGLIARTKSNSYRRALFQCVEIETPEFAQVRVLAVCTLDAAISRLDPKLAADLLFGVNFQTFSDDIPMDERNLDSTYAHQEHDRGLGKSVQLESRHSIASRRGVVGTNLVAQVISPLVTATITAKRGWYKEWMLSYDGLAAHALLLLGKGNAGGMVSCSKSLEIRRNQAAQFLALLPELMHSPMGGGPASYFLVGIPHVNAPDYDQQMYGGVMNALVNGTAAAEPEALIEKFVQLQKRSSKGREEALSVEVSARGSFDDMIQRVSNVFMADTNVHDTSKQATVKRDLKDLRESMSVFFQVDALVSLLKDLAVGGGVSMQSINFAGVAFSEDGTFVQTMAHKYSKSVYAPISQRLANFLLMDHVGGGGDSIVSGATLKLAGNPAIPCVCEAPASLSHLFAHDGSGIVAQGVTWQSLYLVFKDGWMIFAQPIPGGPSGEGRIIGACLLERTFVDRDAAPVDQGSPARRLLFAYASFDPNPPPLFLFDDLPEKDNGHVLARKKSYVSHLDVWCENERSSNYAYQVASSQIFAAKAKRGRRMLSFLAPGSRFLDVAST
ncbi:hypothetical protein ACA910_000507 [Epithemia clementina (nom. ined.)]